jgi:DNA-binding CsgD family transcriptional regulator
MSAAEAARGGAPKDSGTEDPRPELRRVQQTARRRGQGRCDRLSGKERMVIAALARGFTTDEVATLLHVSPHTVRTHVKNLMRKLDARTRAHAVAIALSEHAIEGQI